MRHRYAGRMANLPETRYAQSGEVSIAYRVHGEGDRDLVLAMPWVSHLDLQWESQAMSRDSCVASPGSRG